MFWLKFCMFEDGYIWNVVYEADFDISLVITQYYFDNISPKCGVVYIC